MRYELRAMRDGERVMTLSYDAMSEHDAVGQAHKQGYAVLTVKARAPWLQWSGRSGPRFSLILFSQELLALLQAGLTLVEAIETMAEKEHGPDARKMLLQMIIHLHEGRSLSYSMQQFPTMFPALYVATVRASEKTGDLAEALSRFIDYQSRMDALRKQMVSAAIYPALLLCIGALVTMFLMLYVVPRFGRVYADIGNDLPFFSQLLMNIGQFLDANSMPVLIGTAVAVAGMVNGMMRPAFRQRLMRGLWRLPKVGERIRIYQLARFYRTLGMLLRGGIPAATALDMVAGLLQPALRGQLALAVACIREGQPMSHAMERYGLTTPVAQRMLRVGERTGSMGETAERIARFYDDETARWIDWFSRLFEPLLMAVIGIAIGIIVVLMYLPIFELAGSIQ